jgi:hypothetical protein
MIANMICASIVISSLLPDPSKHNAISSKASAQIYSKLNIKYLIKLLNYYQLYIQIIFEAKHNVIFLQLSVKCRRILSVGSKSPTVSIRRKSVGECGKST